MKGVLQVEGTHLQPFGQLYFLLELYLLLRFLDSRSPGKIHRKEVHGV